jgi:hypothetical protein
MRCRWWSARLAAVCIAVALGAPSVAAEVAAPVAHEQDWSTSGVALPQTCLIGMTVEDLGGFDYTRHSFEALLWVWSRCPLAEIQPLARSAKFPTGRALQIETDPPYFVAEDAFVEYQRVQGTFQHDWNLADFPFDVQTLRIPLDELDYGEDTLVFAPDPTPNGSIYVERDPIPGFRVTDFDVTGERIAFASNYGDADASGGFATSSIVATVELSRSSYIGFFKLCVGAFAGALLALTSFFIRPDETSGYTAQLRTGIGGVFAVLVSLNVAANALGNPTYLTLVDQIHIASLVLVLATVVVAMIERRRTELGLPIVYPNYRLASGFLAVYLGVIGLLVANAAGLFAPA